MEISPQLQPGVQKSIVAGFVILIRFFCGGTAQPMAMAVPGKRLA
jgi:hypothetical protein